MSAVRSFASCLREWAAPRMLDKHLSNHLTPADRQWTAQVVMDFRVRRVAECMKDGSGEIVRLDAAVAGMAANGIRAADDLSALDAPTGEGRRVDEAPVVAAAAAVHPGRAAELRGT